MDLGIECGCRSEGIGETAVFDGLASGGSVGQRPYPSRPFDRTRGALGLTRQKTLEARVMTFYVRHALGDANGLWVIGF